MPIFFERPVGPSADLKELEYCSALMQTCPNELRQNASITAEDIRIFLRSRYGILVDEEEIRKTVISGLGGGESDEEIIDLMEVVCILLIPTILKAARLETDENSPISKKLPKGVVPPEPELIKKVLTMMLEDVTGDAKPKPLNERLVSSLFEAYGEMELSRDESLHKAMVQAANPTGKANAKLDLNAFASGLVNDIEEYDLKNETRTTSNMDDVLLTRRSHEIVKGDVVVSERELSYHDVENKKKRSTPILTEWTAQSIDSTVGNYRNKYLMVTLVATVMISYFAYWYDQTFFDNSGMCPEYVYDYYAPWTVNAKTVTCQIGFSILAWLFVFVTFSFFGLFFVGLGSLGNGVGTIRVWWPWVGLIVVFVLVVPAYIFNNDVRAQYLLDTASLVLGILVMTFHLFNFVVLVTRTQFIEKYPRLKRLLRSSRLDDRKDLKIATQHKINRMVQNALKIHSQDEERGRILGSHFACGLHSFASNVDPVEKDGGFQWTWRLLLDNSLVVTYGVWLSDRLLSGNLAQYVVSIYVLVAGIQFSMYVVDEYSKEDAKIFIHNITSNFFQPRDDISDIESFLATFSGYAASYLAGDCTNATILPVEEVESLCTVTEGVYDCQVGASKDFLCTFALSTSANETRYEISHQLALLAASGFNVTGLEESAEEAFSQAADASIDSLYPSSEYMIRIPLIVGTATAFMTSIYLAVTFLPSITSTILQLRCGRIPTMANQDFNKYRCAPDQVSLITGSMFWGSLLGSFLVGSFVGLLLFLCLWQATVFYMARLIALLIGVLAVAVIRISILSICRCKMYRAFYRERPFSANVSLLALEWANFSLSVGFILVRMIKLVISACMFIGRIDTPFLAPKVGQIGPIELDNYPTIFMKDLLQHEAHRHPYIELLGVMYLMKLRYRESFGSKAGAAWRLLFVYSLLPWMHKYRIQIGGDMGFLLQGLAETTRGRMSILMSQRFELSPEDMDEDGNEQSKIFRNETSTITARMELENIELKNQLESLIRRQNALLAKIRALEDSKNEDRTSNGNEKSLACDPSTSDPDNTSEEIDKGEEPEIPRANVPPNQETEAHDEQTNEDPPTAEGSVTSPDSIDLASL